MKTTKLTRTLVSGMMTCSLALTTVAATAMAVAPQVTRAATKTSEDFKLNLHKFKVLDGRQFENTGSALPVDGLEALSGIDFGVYNVTKLYSDLNASGNFANANAVAKHITDNWATLTADATFIADITTNANGVASMNLPKTTMLDGNAVNSVFVFVERYPEAGANKDYLPAQPFLLGMNQKLADQGTVDLYAKNYATQKDLLGDNNVALPDGYYSKDVGKALHYTSSSPIPMAIIDPEAGYKALKFLDEMTTKGTDLVSIDRIGYYDGERFEDLKPEFDRLGSPLSSNDADWPSDKHAGFSYNFAWNWADMDADMEALLNKLAGRKLEFHYTMAINDDADAYVEIGNDFYTTLTNQHGDDTTTDNSPRVETGGHDFTKVDSETNKGLSGAHFKIRRATADGGFEWLKLTDKDFVAGSGVYDPELIEWKSTQEEGTALISGTGGKLSVMGLAAGDYELIETKAPAGYTFEKAETAFTINKAEQGATDIASKTITNDPNPNILPITGGVGIISFLAIGAAAMGGAVYLKKRKA